MSQYGSHADPEQVALPSSFPGSHAQHFSIKPPELWTVCVHLCFISCTLCIHWQDVLYGFSSLLSFQCTKGFYFWIAGETCTWTAWLVRTQAQAHLDLSPKSASWPLTPLLSFLFCKMGKESLLLPHITLVGMKESAWVWRSQCPSCRARTSSLSTFPSSGSAPALLRTHFCRMPVAPTPLQSTVV